MKRELAFALESQTQLLASPLGRTRSSSKLESPIHSNGVSDTPLRLTFPEANGVSPNRRSKRIKSDSSNYQIEEEKIESIINEELTFEAGVDSDSSKRSRGRYSRAAFKPREEKKNVSLDDSSVVPQAVEDEANGGYETSRSPKSKMELKMSKKIALKSVPGTVRELIDTGMLEGLRVTYIGVKKAYSMPGIIKDGGILCFCSSCKGNSVVTPAKFELHACNSYKRPCQYIEFENGKNFHDILTECKNNPLETLEATIKNALGPLPGRNEIVCRSCKGIFPALNSTKTGLCSSCLELEESDARSRQTTAAKARAPKQLPARKPSKPVSFSISSQKKRKWMISHDRSTKLVARTKSSKHASEAMPLQERTQRRDLRLHKLVFEDNGLPDGTELGYYGRGKKLLVGYKKGSGILCRCCNSVVSASQFEAHAGRASRRKPYSYIYTSNGVSLHELAISLSRGRKYSAKDNDDLCSICADGGNLLLCDGCPRAFHKECASVSRVPLGDWYCQYCQNMFQREKYLEHNANALAAGRVAGVDPIEQITTRCIRIVKNPGVELSGCSLCRGYDFSRSGFGPRTVIICDQCEKEFHVGCLKKSKMADLKELPRGMWFCSVDCKRIHSALMKLVRRGPEKLEDNLLDAIIRKQEKQSSGTVPDVDVRWRVLSGQLANSESGTRLLLSKAVGIFHDCFDPIVDSTTGRDLIPDMVFGRNNRGQEFGGMHCAILTVNSCVVSAGIFRVFGQEVAELPLVATTNDSQGKGYFQVLFTCIEKLLAFLKVKSLVLPAAEGAESIWTDRFGFEKTTPDQVGNFRRSCFQLLTFQGTTMLHKRVPECRIIRKENPDTVVAECWFGGVRTLTPRLKGKIAS
ncbi:Tify domain binding domain, partial [Dillenia turbinata]